MKKLIAAGAVLFATSAWGGEVIVNPPVVNKVPAEKYVIFLSVEDPNQGPGSPPGTSDDITESGTFTTETGKIYRIDIKIDTTEEDPPEEPADPEAGLVGLERAIYELQEAAGIRP